MSDLKGPASDVFEMGLSALARGDVRLHEDCVRELRSRRTRNARELGEELAEEDASPRREPASERRPEGFTVDVGAVAEPVVLLTDGAIVEARTRLIQEAKQTLWLSTFTFTDTGRSLTRLLARRARDGVDVHLIVSYGRDKNTTSELLDELEHAGVHVHADEATHSKVVVVDDEQVLIGSANLNRSFRDLALLVSSRSLAREATRYLRTLTRRSSHGD